jgi:hypothetical protein
MVSMLVVILIGNGLADLSCRTIDQSMLVDHLNDARCRLVPAILSEQSSQEDVETSGLFTFVSTSDSRDCP